MTANRLKGWLLHWPRVAAAWRDLTRKDRAYVVTQVPAAGIAVHHVVRATIYRHPVEQISKKDMPMYYTAQRIYAAGVIRDTVYVVPEADSAAQARAIVAERLAMQAQWSEVARAHKQLCDGVTVDRGDVVIFDERIE